MVTLGLILHLNTFKYHHAQDHTDGSGSRNVAWGTRQAQGKCLYQLNEGVEQPGGAALWANAQGVVNIVLHEVIAAMTFFRAATGQARVLYSPCWWHLGAVYPGDSA